MCRYSRYPVLPHFTYNEFYIPVTDWMLQRDPKEELLKAFRLFDDDQTGKISLRNLRRVARELGENMSEDELRAMIDEFDTDNDGESKLSVCSGVTDIVVRSSCSISSFSTL